MITAAQSRFNPVFAGQGTTIFTVMSALAAEHSAINLGQGFPDEDGPLAATSRATRSASTICASTRKLKC